MANSCEPSRILLMEAMTNALKVEGAFIELGVFKGASLAHIARFACKHGRIVRGFDSFMGMAEPTDKDELYYPKGSLNAHGIDSCVNILRTVGVYPDSYKLIQGFIPQSLSEADFDKIAFAHIDLDQYEPTRVSLDWVWSKLPVGGVILCHDYFKGRQRLAALAIDEFLNKKVTEYSSKELDYTLMITRRQ